MSYYDIHLTGINPTPTLCQLLEKVCDKLKLTKDAVKGKSRRRILVVARTYFAHKAKQHGYTEPEIAPIINHSRAVIFHYNKVMKDDRAMIEYYKYLFEKGQKPTIPREVVFGNNK